jgi:hypothetical protein
VNTAGFAIIRFWKPDLSKRCLNTNVSFQLVGLVSLDDHQSGASQRIEQMIMDGGDVKPNGNMLPPATVEQLRRVSLLLELAAGIENADERFVQYVATLHVARSIPEYWFTVADNISIDSGKKGAEKNSLRQRLLDQFEDIFRKARRYELLTTLRQWDYHWEPIRNPATCGPGEIYGRGAPLRMAAGPSPGSVSYTGGNQLITTGSGRRIGRSNYYRIQSCKYVDFDRSEAVSLGLALQQFVEDLPRCMLEILAIPEVTEYLKAH